MSNTPEETCRQQVYSDYSFVVARVYADKYFPITEHRATRDAIMNVWKALRNDIIKEVPWMDEDTKRKVNQRLDDLEVDTGYPDWLLDDKELDKEYEGEKHPDWPTDPLEVNAHFSQLPWIGKYDLTMRHLSVCKEGTK